MNGKGSIFSFRSRVIFQLPSTSAAPAGLLNSTVMSWVALDRAIGRCWKAPSAAVGSETTEPGHLCRALSFADLLPDLLPRLFDSFEFWPLAEPPYGIEP